MKKYVIVFVVLALAVLAFMPAQTVETDTAKLVEMTEEWNRNALTGNFEANVETYLPDALRIGPSEGVLSGKEVIRQSFKSFHQNYKLTICDNKVKDIRVSGDLAVVRGTYSGAYVPKAGGASVHENGHWVVVYERQNNGTWKCAYSIYTEIKE